MIPYVSPFLKDFFDRNLFERLIIYMFLSILITKVVFELILGQWSFHQAQNQQWIFYGFLALDYLFSFKKIINIRITINPISLFAGFLFIMLAHGLFVGVMNHNPPFVILNDTVPILMIALNILRMQSFEEIKKPIDFRFLLIASTLLTGGICFFGFLAGEILIGNSALFYPLILAALIAVRPFPKWVFIAICIMVLLTLGDMNRTILLFTALVTLSYIAINSLYHPTRMAVFLLSLCAFLFVAWNVLPEDSKTRQRITGLTEINLSQRTGSIGERQAEQDAVTLKLQRTGTTAEWTGLGFGGLYEVQFTHEYLTNYGHAHFSWVWFNLRYGKIGYLYLAILLSALLYNGIRSFNQRTELGLFIAFLCLSGLLYSLTYVNSIFLLSGLHFCYLTRNNTNSEDDKNAAS